MEEKERQFHFENAFWIRAPRVLLPDGTKETVTGGSQKEWMIPI